MNIKTKRLLAYLIDSLIIFAVIFLLNLIFKNNNELLNINEMYFNGQISFNEYFEQYKVISHNIDKDDIIINIVNTLLIIVIFVVIPYFNNYQTIGQKILKIKFYKDTELKFEDLVNRAVIVNGLGYMIFMFIILYLTSDNLYFILINLFGFFQILVAIISGFMILYRKDKLGLQDLLTNTSVKEI